MESNHLVNIDIKGFKRLSSLKLTDLGQFNLIVGDNNTGKTTLLEALLVQKNSGVFLDFLAEILYYVKRFNSLSSNFFSHYFNSAGSTSTATMLFELQFKNDSREAIKYTKIGGSEFHQHYLLNGKIEESAIGPAFFHQYDEHNRQFNFKSPFIPYGPVYSHELTKIYGNEIQVYVDKKEKLINSLSHIIENIQNIEVSASYSNWPVLLIAEKKKNNLLPLATYGDGALKLFRILLSLFSSSDYSRIMIDEIDTGIHYSRLKSFFDSLFLVAGEQQKQIFATTHSKECIEEYRNSLKTLGVEDKGRIIRLTEVNGEIKSFTMRFPEFDNALYAESEIR